MDKNNLYNLSTNKKSGKFDSQCKTYSQNGSYHFEVANNIIIWTFFLRTFMKKKNLKLVM